MQIIQIIKNFQIAKSTKTNIFEIRSYDAVIDKLKLLTGKATITKINSLDITNHMKTKIIYMINNNIIKKPSLQDELNNILGIGKSKIKELVNLGLKKIDDLSNPKYFNQLSKESQMIYLEKPIRKIPHKVIRQLENALNKSMIQFVIVGSYRRKLPFSRDIDILLNPNSDLKDFLLFLKSTCKLKIYKQGDASVSAIITFNKKKYKIDIFKTKSNIQFAATLLYSTGSKSFNIRMRKIAKSKGFLLNQYGLFTRSTSKQLLIRTEKGFFKRLNIKYILPEFR